MKANSKDITLKNISKLLLNSLIGKYGMNPLQPITRVINKEKVGDILLTRKILLEVDITDKDTLLSYLPGPNKNITNEFNIELQDALNLVGGVDKQTFIKNISIPVASAVTSYARIYMSKVKLDILSKGGKIFYSDTDSIITDIEMDKEYVDQKQIGKFKLEYFIDKAIMPSPKVYILKLKDNKFIKKVKGGISKNLTIENYKRLY